MFRSKVYDERKIAYTGEVVVTSTKIENVLFAIIFICSMAVAYWITNFEYTRKETVKGWIEPIDGIVRVYPSKAGMLSDLHVKDGQKISKGDVLAVIQESRFTEEGESLQKAARDTLDSSMTLLDLQIGSLAESREEKINRLHEELEYFRSTKNIAVERYNNYQHELRLVMEELTKIKSLLVKGFLTETDKIKVEEKYYRIIQNKLQTKSIVEEANQNINRVKYEIKEEKRSTDREISRIKRNIAELEQEGVLRSLEGSYVLRSTREGRVSNISFSEGQYLDTTNHLMMVLPEDPEYIAYLMVPENAAGTIKKGQLVEVRYDAFPYQSYGTYSGIIVEVYDGVILPGDLPNGEINITKPSYKVKVRLAQQDVKVSGISTSLKPGMILAADISVESRSILNWVVDPILKFRGSL